MSWDRQGNLFIYKEEIVINKDIVEIQPSDIKLLKFYKGLQVTIQQLGDVKCVWKDTLTEYFYSVPQLTIYYEPFENDELYVQLKYLNNFNGNKHLWINYLKSQTVVVKPFQINDYAGKLNNLLLQLLPRLNDKNEVVVVEWTMKDIQIFQQAIFKNIQSIQLDETLKSKLALLFVKMKKRTCTKEELIECYKHFNTWLYDYIVDVFMQYVCQYLTSYTFTTLEDLYYCLRLVFAIEKTGLPMLLLASIKSKIKNWHANIAIQVDAFEIPFFDSISLNGTIGNQEISMDISSHLNVAKCQITKSHSIC